MLDYVLLLLLRRTSTLRRSLRKILFGHSLLLRPLSHALLGDVTMVTMVAIGTSAHSHDTGRAEASYPFRATYTPLVSRKADKQHVAV